MPVWVDGETVRGYKLEQFADAFHRVLGVRSVRGVRSESPSHAAPNTPNAPNAQGTGEGVDLVVIGDEMYPLLLADAAQNGHITEAEFTRRYQLHKIIEKAREGHAA